MDDLQRCRADGASGRDIPLGGPKRTAPRAVPTNSNGVVSFSPVLVRQHLRWVTKQNADNPEGVALRGCANLIQPLQGLEILLTDDPG